MNVKLKFMKNRSNLYLTVAIAAIVMFLCSSCKKEVYDKDGRSQNQSNKPITGNDDWEQSGEGAMDGDDTDTVALKNEIAQLESKIKQLEIDSANLKQEFIETGGARTTFDRAVAGSWGYWMIFNQLCGTQPLIFIDSVKSHKIVCDTVIADGGEGFPLYPNIKALRDTCVRTLDVCDSLVRLRSELPQLYAKLEEIRQNQGGVGIVEPRLTMQIEEKENRIKEELFDNMYAVLYSRAYRENCFFYYSKEIEVI